MVLAVCRRQLVGDEESLYRSTDTDLNYRSGLSFLLFRAIRSTLAAFKKDVLQPPDSSVVGVFVQVTDGQKNILYDPTYFGAHRVPVCLPAATDGSTSVTTVPVTTPQNDSWPVRRSLTGRRRVAAPT